MRTSSKMRIYNLILLALLGTMNTGCGIGPFKKKKSPDISQQSSTPLSLKESIVSMADLQLNAGFTLQSTSESDLINALNTDDRLYNNQPNASSDQSSAASNSNTDGCYSYDDMIIESNKVSARGTITKDISDCVKKQPGNDAPTMEQVKYTLRANVYFACDDRDLSVYNGKKLGDLFSQGGKNGNSSGDLCSKGSYLFQVIMDSDIVAASDGGTYETKTHFVSHDGAKDLGPCKVVAAGNNVTNVDQCMYFAKTETSVTPVQPSGSSVNQGTLIKYNLIGISDDSSSGNNVWHKGGKIDVSYNDWSGTLIYTGSATAPKYTLRQGSSGAPIAGSLTATPAN